MTTNLKTTTTQFLENEEKEKSIHEKIRAFEEMINQLDREDCLADILDKMDIKPWRALFRAIQEVEGNS